MSQISTSDRLRSRLRPLFARITDVPRTNSGYQSIRSDVSPIVGRLQEIVQVSGHESIIMQSVLVACLQSVHSALKSEERVAGASISLAQEEKMQELVSELVAVKRILESALTHQGRAMLELSRKEHMVGAPDRWWYALSEAIEELEKGTERVSSLVGNQPKGTEARLLAGAVVRLLHSHHAQLVVEAEEWMA
ncbi:MAG: hypothetical protein ACOCTG_01145 [Bacteroidota bacterium]